MKKLLLFLTIACLTACSNKIEEVEPIMEPEVFVPLDVSVTWDNTFEYQGTEYTYCSIIDIDVYVLNEAGRDVTGLAAARANCPENFQLGEDRADDDLTVYISGYNHLELSGFGIDPLNIPVTMTFTRGDRTHVSVFDTISTNDSIWEIRDRRQLLIPVGTISKVESDFEWAALGEEKVVL